MQPGPIPTCPCPIDTGAENIELISNVPPTSQYTDKTCGIERMHVRMPTRACGRDAMVRQYIRSSLQCVSAEVLQLPTFSELGAAKLRLVTVRSQTSDFDIFVDTTTGRHFRSIEAFENEAPKNIRRNGFQVDGHAHEGPGEQISGPRGPFGQF